MKNRIEEIKKTKLLEVLKKSNASLRFEFVHNVCGYNSAYKGIEEHYFNFENDNLKYFYRNEIDCDSAEFTGEENIDVLVKIIDEYNIKDPLISKKSLTILKENDCFKLNITNYYRVIEALL